MTSVSATQSISWVMSNLQQEEELEIIAIDELLAEIEQSPKITSQSIRNRIIDARDKLFRVFNRRRGLDIVTFTNDGGQLQ